MRSLILITILIYLGITFYAYLISERVIFQPQRSSYRDTKQIRKLKTADGAIISALYLPNQNASHTVLFSHGNAEDLGTLGMFLGELKSMGFAVFAYDYHGYGTSTGPPSESHAYLDVDAAYNYLTDELGVPPDRIISYGRSLGGAVAADLASRKPVGGLVLESTFISAYRVVTKVPLFPFDKFRTLAKLECVRCPVLVIHGKKDEVIAFWHGERLFAEAHEPKQSLWIAEARHNNLHNVAGKRYHQAFERFKEILTQRGSLKSS